MEAETTNLFDLILAEARVHNGTWSQSFLADVGKKLQQMKQKQQDSLVHLLLLSAAKKTEKNTTKFKIAQLLSCLKNFFCESIVKSLSQEEKTISECIENTNNEEQMADKTREMFNNLLNNPNTKNYKPQVPKIPSRGSTNSKNDARPQLFQLPKSYSTTPPAFK